jgi:hypothetical protein
MVRSRGYLVVLARKKIVDRLVATMTLASCGAILIYFVQGEGRPYHTYPALALMVMAMVDKKDLCGVSLSRRLRRAHPGDCFRRTADQVHPAPRGLAARRRVARRRRFRA